MSRPSCLFIPARTRTAALLTLAAIALLAGGCGQSGFAEGTHGLAQMVGAATTVPEPADFVKKSRKGDADYMAVGITPPSHSVKPHKPDEVQKLENDLDSTRARHDALAGRKPPADTKAAAPGKPKPKKKRPAATGE